MLPFRSSRVILLAILAPLVVLLLTSCAGAGPEPAPAPQVAVVPFDSVVEHTLRWGSVPGAVVAVVVGDTVGFLKAYGYVTMNSVELLGTGARF